MALRLVVLLLERPYGDEPTSRLSEDLQVIERDLAYSALEDERLSIPSVVQG
ncbi:hypothetical protein [Aquamicrobium sp.]|uniref:hypothetical protein n=1 Tax=Aquamicrobium sp. TaxID=1872579 RepID=UPI00258E70D6|nr:hypothetical protein [Aquamicrobium sp.]MCK9549449.1 hypothetical protein [Aquamicrobium sp.]